MDNKPTPAWWLPGMKLFVQVSGWIVFPIIAAVYSGRFLDIRYGTEPRYFYICVGIGFVVTNAGIAYLAVREIKRLKRSDEDINKSPDIKK